jgi:hypothetical protein
MLFFNFKLEFNTKKKSAHDKFFLKTYLTKSEKGYISVEE